MTAPTVWMITGAGRGMGLSFAKEALATHHPVVATGRDPDAVARAIGDAGETLAVKLDVTSTTDAQRAVDAAEGYRAMDERRAIKTLLTVGG